MSKTKSPFEAVHSAVAALPWASFRSNYEARRALQNALRRHGWQKWEYEAAAEDAAEAAGKTPEKGSVQKK